MATTPSGLSIEEAEKLSASQKITIPSPGELFRVVGAGGIPQIGYTDASGIPVWLTAQPEDGDWANRTQASWRDEANKTFLTQSGLNLNDIAEINLPDYNASLAYKFAQPGDDINKALARVPVKSVQLSDFVTGLGGKIEQFASMPSQEVPASPVAPASPEQMMMSNYTSLVDIWSSRSDLQADFPGGTEAGTDDNQKLNDWWNQYGVKEYPTTTLVQPGDKRIAPPVTAEMAAATSGQPTAAAASPTDMISGDGSIKPEDTVTGIKSILGSDWSPKAAFANLQAKGIYGAVRVSDSADPNKVYLIGPGGYPIDNPEQFKVLFGTTEQGGIVDLITSEQAAKLKITLPDGSSSGKTGGTGGGSNVISPDILRDVSDIDLSGASNTKSLITSDPDVVAANIQKYIELQRSAKTDEQKKAEIEMDTLTAKIDNLLNQSEGRGAAQLAEEEKRDVAGLTQIRDDADSALEIKMAEVSALDAKYQAQFTDIEGKAITMSSMSGQQAQLYRTYQASKNVLLSEASLLQVKSLAAQKKLDSAQTAANRAVDLKYADIETELNIRIQQLNLLKDEWNAEEKIRADALNQYYSDLKTQIADQKAEEKDIQSVAIQAILAGATADVINKIQGASSAVQAAYIAQPYLKKAEEVPTSVVKVGDKVQLINTQTGEVIKELGTEDQVSQSVVGSSATGYQLITYDKQGNIVNRQAISGGDGEGTQSERNQQALQTAAGKLLVTQGGNGYVDGNMYMELRRTYTGGTSEFDSKLGYLLSPDDKQKFLGAEEPATTRFLSKEYFESQGEEWLKAAAEGAGYRNIFTSWNKEKENFINAMMELVETYRAGGMSDEEILKLMQ